MTHMSIVRALILVSGAAVAIVGFAQPVRAQRQSPARIELGVDAMLANTNVDRAGDSNSTTTFDLPLQAFRIGFELTPKIYLEPTFGLQTVSDGGSARAFTFDIALPIELATGGSPGSDFFFRPLFGLRNISTTFNSVHTSFTQSSFGLGLGARVPIISRLAARFEARYRRGLETDRFPAYNEIGLLGGLSFFTR